MFCCGLCYCFVSLISGKVIPRPFSQNPQCTCPISHNAPFRTEMRAFLFWIVHCGIWDRCIVGFVNLVSWYWGHHVVMPVVVKQPWKLWVNMSQESLRNIYWTQTIHNKTIHLCHGCSDHISNSTNIYSMPISLILKQNVCIFYSRGSLIDMPLLLCMAFNRALICWSGNAIYS